MKLTKSQKHWLLELDKPENRYGLSIIYQKPPGIVMHALKRMGFCKCIHETFWKITEKGSEMAGKLRGIQNDE